MFPPARRILNYLDVLSLLNFTTFFTRTHNNIFSIEFAENGKLHEIFNLLTAMQTFYFNTSTLTMDAKEVYDFNTIIEKYKVLIPQFTLYISDNMSVVIQSNNREKNTFRLVH